MSNIQSSKKPHTNNEIGIEIEREQLSRTKEREYGNIPVVIEYVHVLWGIINSSHILHNLQSKLTTYVFSANDFISICYSSPCLIYNLK